ncbi:MAG: nucleotidyl transferase AbiEii/AbiGii toxin family protein [Bacteroidetes bacterium]|nr:nucleotidyl transferase AbiEii/AbiGii toxin family protein [Bacteroidota bacterium]
MDKYEEQHAEFHNDFEMFTAALSFTEAVTGFNSRLLEKDYYCSLILKGLEFNNTNLVFKGGTCLSKVYSDFYRLSEDLDFVIPTPVNVSRSRRRALIDPIKIRFIDQSSIFPELVIEETLQGHNNSRQYIGYVSYKSVISGLFERIKVEIGLRESLIMPMVTRKVKTILQDSFTRSYIIDPFPLTVIDFREAFSEKCRAALSRRDPAIRDFYDILYGVKKLGLQIDDAEFISFVKQKLMVPGSGAINISLERFHALSQQVETELRPVLREQDYSLFNLEESFQLMIDLAVKINDLN